MARVGERVTQSELSRRTGVSRQAIHKHVKAGVLVRGEDGLIDVDHARDAIRTLHPGAKTVRATAAQEPAQQLASAPQPTPEDDGPLGDGMPMDYQWVRTLREAEEARIARLKREEMEGSLIRLDAVRAVAAGVLAATREALLQIPARMATVLAAEDSPARVHELLQQELHQALGQLSAMPDRVGADAQEMAAQ